MRSVFRFRLILGGGGGGNKRIYGRQRTIRGGILNPRSREGSDRVLETSAACLCILNPHSPEGSDWNPKSEMLRFQEFQSTPPMKGAAVHVAYEASHVLISIHAPVKGATGRLQLGLAMLVISIHAPVKGATHPSYWSYQSAGI